MDFEQLCKDYNLDYRDKGHKHCRDGWINIPCPFCTGNPGYHLGFDTALRFFKCWRCGWHPQAKVIKEILNLPTKQAVNDVLRLYGGYSGGKVPGVSSLSKISLHPFRFPKDTGPLSQVHAKYLISRGFDPNELVKDWGIMSSARDSELDGIEYYNRIIIPIKWEGRIVSFQGRTVNPKVTIKYRACPMAREEKNHKRILYGNQDYWHDRIGICVEGVTDVWKMGPKAFAVFGIEYHALQVREIAKRFDKVAVLFDDDPQAIKQAEKLVGELRFRGVDARQYYIDGDPGSLSMKAARHLAEGILKDISND